MEIFGFFKIMGLRKSYKVDRWRGGFIPHMPPKHCSMFTPFHVIGGGSTQILYLVEVKEQKYRSLVNNIELKYQK